MAEKYNNARSTLAAPFSSSGTSLVCKTGEGALFPTGTNEYTIEKIVSGIVTRRDIVKLTRSGDTFSVVTRNSQACVQDETADPRTRTSNPNNFDSGDFISLRVTEGDWAEIMTQIFTTLVNSIATKLALAGGTITGLIKGARGTALASAATVTLENATGNFVHITGTTGITSFGANTAGTRIEVVFDGALLLTHNATSLILPTNANITTAAGDSATFVGEGGSNWRCLKYQKQNGGTLLPATIDINGQTEETGLQKDGDFIIIWNAAIGENRKVRISNFSKNQNLVYLTRGTNVGSGTVTTAHGLGRTPGRIRAKAITPGSTSGNGISMGNWKNDGSNTNNCVYVDVGGSDCSTNGTYAIRGFIGGAGQLGVINNVTTANFDIVFTGTTATARTIGIEIDLM